jgi:hypothetical protein
LALAAAFPGSEKFAASLLHISHALPQASGEVHAALMWSRGTAEPRFRASLYCPDWFASDADVLAAANAVTRMEHRQQQSQQGIYRRRWFTFLGIDGDSVTLYSHV